MLAIASTNAVSDAVRSLQRKGLVTTQPKTARSLVLTPEGRLWCLEVERP